MPNALNNSLEWLVRGLRANSSHRWWTSYVLAAVLVAAVSLLRWELEGVLGNEAPLLLYLMAVMISAWHGAAGPGIFATILGGLVGIYLFMEPALSIKVAASADLIRVTIFFVEGFLLTVLSTLLHRARERSELGLAKLEVARAEAENAKRRAEEANTMKSRFLANVSHEIRTPMTAILGFNELLIDAAMSPSDRQQFTEIIANNGRSLCRILDDILDLAKIEAGALTLEHVVFSLPDIVREVFVLLDIPAKRNGVDLVFDPNSVMPDLIVSDPTRIRQILFNVIGNAIKFSHDGRVSMRIFFESTLRFVTITVRDSGIGISEEQAKELFQPFVQADTSTTRSYGGTGLGLALSRRLARALGGDLILSDSKLGLGSTFTITFPVAIASKAEGTSQKKAETLAPSGDLRPLVGTNVLVVEDSVALQLLLRQLLLLSGATVEVAGDGLSGVETVLKGHFDVILMDVQMPNLDGYGATARLREAGCKVPIIALTAHAETGALEQALQHGCDGYLAKPFDRTTLVETIKRHRNGPSLADLPLLGS